MTDTTRPGAYLMNGSLFFRMPDRSIILCKCIGEPFSRMIVDMWNAKQAVAVPATGLPPGWRLRSSSGEELA